MTEQINAEKIESGKPEMTELIIQRMAGIGPWLRFFSILGFIAIGFMLLMIILFSTTGLFKQPGMEAVPVVLFVIMFLIFGVIYFFPSYFLFRSSSGIKLMKSGNVVEGMEESLKYMKAFWMYIGILAIIFLSIYALMLIPMVFFGLFKAASPR